VAIPPAGYLHPRGGFTFCEERWINSNPAIHLIRSSSKLRHGSFAGYNYEFIHVKELQELRFGAGYVFKSNIAVSR